MRYVNVLIIILVVILSCNGCLLVEERFSCDPNDVESVTIVILDGYNGETNQIKRTILHEVEDIPTFIQELSSIECRINRGEPISMEIGSIAIEIVYKSGAHDLISHNAQLIFQTENYSHGYWCFDQQQFETLIGQYVANIHP